MFYVHILDLVGVFAFAVYGARKAIVARLDPFGALVCAGLTALGGGTIREIMLHGTPAYLHDYSYIAVVGLGVGLAVVAHRRFGQLDKYLQVLDAIGLATFAYEGAYRADAVHLGLGAMILFAVMTALGGGVLADIVAGRRPDAFHKDFYALAALVLAITYYAIGPIRQQPAPALMLITLSFVVRLVSLRLKWKLWLSREHAETLASVLRKCSSMVGKLTSIRAP